MLIGVQLVFANQGEHAPSTSGAPSVVSYQGYITEGGTVYNGTGYFKFALINPICFPFGKVQVRPKYYYGPYGIRTHDPLIS